MTDEIKAKEYDLNILTTHDVVCLAAVRSYAPDYGNFLRSQKNNKIIYTFDNKLSYPNILPALQYIIFPDQEAKPQDNQWIIGFLRNANNQDADLTAITKLLDILEVDYKLTIDTISDTQIMDILTVKSKTIEALSAVINLYENSIAEIYMSLIVALKEMVKWESRETIDMVNTKVAAWLSVVEKSISEQNKLNLVALPHGIDVKEINDQQCENPDEQYCENINYNDYEVEKYSSELACPSDVVETNSYIYYYNLYSLNSKLSNQSNQIVNRELKIINEHVITCSDNSQVNPINFMEGKDTQLYLTIEKLIVDLRTKEMIEKYSLEQLKYILAAKIHNNCYTDVPKFSLEKKQYLEKFNKYIQAENSEGSSSWKSGFSHVTKHIKVWFGVGSSAYDAGVMLSWISGIENGHIVVKCGKFVVSSLLAISLVTEGSSDAPVMDIPKNSILNEMACKISLCNLASNEDLDDNGLKQVATFLNGFVKKYFAKNNVLFTNQSDISQLMLGKLANQTLLNDLGMDKSINTVLKTVSGGEIPLLKMVAYNSTECQDYIANSLTGLSSIFEFATAEQETVV